MVEKIWLVAWEFHYIIVCLELLSSFMGRIVLYVKDDYIRGRFWCLWFELSPWKTGEDCFKPFLCYQLQRMKWEISGNGLLYTIIIIVGVIGHRKLSAAVSNLSCVCVWLSMTVLCCVQSLWNLYLKPWWKFDIIYMICKLKKVSVAGRDIAIGNT